MEETPQGIGKANMSLDVYLTMENVKLDLSGSGIFVRENGQTKEITREEWNRRFPDREPVVVKVEDDDADTEVYTANITHNLTKMASEAGIYQHLWRPDEIDVKKAKDLIEPLKDGLALLQSDPERFKVFNPLNGWGYYEGFVRFVGGYLTACYWFPEADVSVWR